MLCRECGLRNLPTSNFCAECGASLAAARNAAPPDTEPNALVVELDDEDGASEAEILVEELAPPPNPPPPASDRLVVDLSGPRSTGRGEEPRGRTPLREEHSVVFCSNCGFENESQSAYCAECGTSLRPHATAVPPSASSTPTIRPGMQIAACPNCRGSDIVLEFHKERREIQAAEKPGCLAICGDVIAGGCIYLFIPVLGWIVLICLIIGRLFSAAGTVPIYLEKHYRCRACGATWMETERRQ